MNKRKAPADNPNSAFCDFLLELADYEKNVNRNIHKYTAYRNAASTLSHHPVKIKNGGEAKALKGIGQKIADKIDEFIQTGSLQKLEKIRADDTSMAISLLTRVSGIGPAAAHKLVKDGITTIDDLRKNAEKLNHHQTLGLKYFEDFEKKIPQEEVTALKEKIVKICQDLDKNFLVTICGSYRRGAAQSGDIDILLTHLDYTSTDGNKSELLEQVVEALKRSEVVVDQLSFGSTKFMGVCRLGDKHPYRRIDIRLCPHDQYYCALLYFTGSDLFNQQMRAHAVERGFTLNEYNIRPIGSRGTPGEPLPVSSEADIFDYIDYPYKEPTERNI